jgi:hypothetical protein
MVVPSFVFQDGFDGGGSILDLLRLPCELDSASGTYAFIWKIVLTKIYPLTASKRIIENRVSAARRRAHVNL